MEYGKSILIDSQLFEGKRVLIMGVANEFSIAWGIAKSLHEQGAKICLGFLPGRSENKVKALAEKLNAEFVYPCDVGCEKSVYDFFVKFKSEFEDLDILVHGLAYADKEDLKGEYFNVSRASFLKAMEISCYSFTQIAMHCKSLMNNGGSMLTLTYYGSQKFIPNYNVMGVVKAALESSVRYLASDLGPFGIRVNAISAGPIRTVAASGIHEFRRMVNNYRRYSPLRKDSTLEDIANGASFLLSELGRNITAEILYIDGGYNSIGMHVPYDDEPE